MSFETKFELFEDSLSSLSSLVSECNDMVQNTNTNMFKNAYLLNECSEIDGLIEDLSNKIATIKNMLMTDKISPDDSDYELLVKEKIIENNKQQKFMEMFGPYMFLHINNEINNEN